MHDTNAACLANPGQGFYFLDQSLTLNLSRALDRGTGNMFSSFLRITCLTAFVTTVTSMFYPVTRFAAHLKI